MPTRDSAAVKSAKVQGKFSTIAAVIGGLCVIVAACVAGLFALSASGPEPTYQNSGEIGSGTTFVQGTGNNVTQTPQEVTDGITNIARQREIDQRIADLDTWKNGVMLLVQSWRTSHDRNAGSISLVQDMVKHDNEYPAPKGMPIIRKTFFELLDSIAVVTEELENVKVDMQYDDMHDLLATYKGKMEVLFNKEAPDCTDVSLAMNYYLSVSELFLLNMKIAIEDAYDREYNKIVRDNEHVLSRSG